MQRFEETTGACREKWNETNLQEFAQDLAEGLRATIIISDGAFVGATLMAKASNSGVVFLTLFVMGDFLLT